MTNSTRTNILPKGSNVFLVALLSLAGISGSTCFAFIYMGITTAWIPGIAALVLIALATGLWFESKRDQDLAGATSTTLTDNDTGKSLTFDPRVMDFQNVTEMLEFCNRIFSTLAYRQPIPAGDGLVDKNGKPDPSKQQEAIKHIAEINAKAQSDTDTIIEQLRGPSHKQPNLKPPNESPKISTNISES